MCRVLTFSETVMLELFFVQMLAVAVFPHVILAVQAFDAMVRVHDRTSVSEADDPSSSSQQLRGGALGWFRFFLFVCCCCCCCSHDVC